MAHQFQNKRVMIVGATGGLGSAFARAFAVTGAQLMLVGRDEAALRSLAAELGSQTDICQFDLAHLEELTDFRAEVEALGGQLDIVVNASGVDVRKPLAAHTPPEVRRLLEVNLGGAIGLTQALLPIMRERGVIAHVGGFADGRLAFPYYSADVATRAGVATFVEAVNRELALDGRDVIVSYFSPSPTDTEAERPFHPIWREMGVTIAPLERVVHELFETIERRQVVHVMGGFTTRLFAKLNAVWPQLADRLALKRYGQILHRRLIKSHQLR